MSKNKSFMSLFFLFTFFLLGTGAGFAQEFSEVDHSCHVLEESSGWNKPKLISEKELGYKIKLKELLKGNFQFARESFRGPDEIKDFTKKAFSGLDIQKLCLQPDNALLVTRGAGIIKGKKPSYFTKELFQNPEVVSKIMGFEIVPSQGTVVGADSPLRVNKAIKILVFTISDIYADYHVAEADLKENKGNFSEEKLQKILATDLDKELGKPEKVFNVNLDKCSTFAKGASFVYKIYPIGKDSSLLIFNNIISVKDSSLPQPSFLVPRSLFRNTVYNMSDDSGMDFIKDWRNRRNQ